ncbi:hypothetical protein COOONC_04091 [Cooperia oncophora]
MVLRAGPGISRRRPGGIRSYQETDGVHKCESYVNDSTKQGLAKTALIDDKSDEFRSRFHSRNVLCCIELSRKITKYYEEVRNSDAAELTEVVADAIAKLLEDSAVQTVLQQSSDFGLEESSLYRNEKIWENREKETVVGGWEISRRLLNREPFWIHLVCSPWLITDVDNEAHN